jgi:8-oxo-dGTP diphosphatase
VALHRELAEELGVAVRLGDELTAPGGGPGWDIRPGYRMRVWRAVVVAGRPAPIEDHDALTWLESGRWLDLGWLPSNRPIVAALQRCLATTDTGDHRQGGTDREGSDGLDELADRREGDPGRSRRPSP